MVDGLSGSLCLKYRLKLVLADNSVQNFKATPKLARVYSRINTNPFKSAWVQVIYTEDESITNEGEYETPQELKSALVAFTEPELREYLAGMYRN